MMAEVVTQVDRELSPLEGVLARRCGRDKVAAVDVYSSLQPSVVEAFLGKLFYLLRTCGCLLNISFVDPFLLSLTFYMLF